MFDHLFDCGHLCELSVNAINVYCVLTPSCLNQRTICYHQCFAFAFLSSSMLKYPAIEQRYLALFVHTRVSSAASIHTKHKLAHKQCVESCGLMAGYVCIGDGSKELVIIYYYLSGRISWANLCLSSFHMTGFYPFLTWLFPRPIWIQKWAHQSYGHDPIIDAITQLRFAAHYFNCWFKIKSK